MKCKVCGKEFELLKENKKFVMENGLEKIFSGSNIKEAFDCTHCGCQNIVNDYLREVTIKDYFKTEDVENGED